MGALVVLASSEPEALHAAVSRMPGPSRGAVTSDRVALNDACLRCHSSHARQWRGSLHQRAFVDEGFATAYGRERRAFCRGCHAPEADPRHEPPSALAALGVACVTCHVPAAADLPGAAVLAAPAGSATERAPHPVVRRRGFAADAACAACHDFDSERNEGLALQTTVAEHRRSAFAEQSCQSCHMPEVGGMRDHGFGASRDLAMLRRAIEVSAEREGPELVRVRLRPAWVGHAVPTGDLFRRLVVEVGPDADDFEATDVRVLSRRFEVRPGRGRTEVADDRLGMPDAPDELRLEVPDAAGQALRWRVVYERADTTRADDPMPPLLGALVVAEGRLQPWEETP